MQFADLYNTNERSAAGCASQALKELGFSPAIKWLNEVKAASPLKR
jgi:hypothetical protein